MFVVSISGYDTFFAFSRYTPISMQRRIKNQPTGEGGEVPTYEFAKLSEKLHEIEKSLGRGEGGIRLRPATGMELKTIIELDMRVP